MPWPLYFAAFGGAYLVLLLCHGLWCALQFRRAISRWLKERDQVLLRMKRNNGFGMLTYEVDARKADGSETHYCLGIDCSFLTGRVREVLEMETIYPFRDKED